MSKNNDFTKQHIVPVSYLKRFAQKGKTAYRIGVIQRGKRHYIASINDVGYIKNYYDIPFLDDIKQWEHYFDDEIESQCNKSMSNFITKTTLSNRDVIIISESDRYIFSKFIIIQSLRVPSFIDYHILSSEEKMDEYKAKIIKKHPFLLNHLDLIKDIVFSRDKIKNIILTSITNPERLDYYCQILGNKPWVVYVNCTALPFITSDNPVVMTNIITLSTSRSDNGIGNENTIFFFPINTHIAIGIYPYRFNTALNKYNGKKIYLTENDSQMIDGMNRTIMLQCHKQCFVPLDVYEDLYRE